MHKQYPAYARLPIAHAQMEAEMNFESVPIIARATPLTASSCSGSNLVCNGNILALLERRYQTIDRYDKEQTSPLASLEACECLLSRPLKKRGTFVLII